MQRSILAASRRMLMCLTLTLFGLHAMAQTNQAIYEDSLVNNWQNYSWSATDFASTSFVHTGTKSVKVTYTSAYQGFYLHHDPFDTTGFSTLSFWINGGTVTGRNIQVQAIIGGTAQTALNLSAYATITAGIWKQVNIPLADLRIANTANVTGFWLQDISGGPQAEFYVDDMTLIANPPPSVVYLAVNSGAPVRTVDSRMFGLNAAVWDNQFNTTNTANQLLALGTKVLRFPGGSLSDTYHWKTNMTDGQTFQWATSFDSFAKIAKSVGSQAFITVNYGSGTSQEAADWVTYSNKTKGYGFKYWEIGNENYGTWENDTHVLKNNAVTYATFAQEAITKMKSVDSTIKVGVVLGAGEDEYPQPNSALNPRTNVTHAGWTPVLLSKLKSLGVMPDFVIYHRYEQGPYHENDAFLLQSAKTWKNDASAIRQELTDYYGTAAARIEIVCTENNSVYTTPGKQSTSLVNGLFLADSFGNLLQTEINSLVWWNFRNGGNEPGNNNAASLYGWRQYGDYGICNGNDLYPTFYVWKALSKFTAAGDRVVKATSDYSLLSVYAVNRANGGLALMVINKSPTLTLNSSIALTGYVPVSTAAVVSYGIPQDNAAQTGVGSPDVQTSVFTGAAPTFRASFAPYSVTILQLRK